MATRLEELVIAQDAFVADASHQLRNPMTALRLRLENLEPDVRPSSPRRPAAASMPLCDYDADEDFRPWLARPARAHRRAMIRAAVLVPAAA